jgi:hypothetical protein
MPPAHSAPITLPTSSVSNECDATCSHPFGFRTPQLNELATDPLSLADYDSFILRSKKDSDDPTASETESTEPGDHEPPSGSDAD